jgi:hypothetical protein
MPRIIRKNEYCSAPKICSIVLHQKRKMVPLFIARTSPKKIDIWSIRWLSIGGYSERLYHCINSIIRKDEQEDWKSKSRLSTTTAPADLAYFILTTLYNIWLAFWRDRHKNSLTFLREYLWHSSFDRAKNKYTWKTYRTSEAQCCIALHRTACLMFPIMSPRYGSLTRSVK